MYNLKLEVRCLHKDAQGDIVVWLYLALRPMQLPTFLKSWPPPPAVSDLQIWNRRADPALTLLIQGERKTHSMDGNYKMTTPII